MPHSLLSGRAIYSLSGEDAIPFLQGLITHDATKLSGGIALYTALLSPQGKFLHDFFLVPAAGNILLDVDHVRADDLIKRLTIYKLRSKVSITPLPDLAVIASWDATPPENATTIHDPRYAPLGTRSYGNKEILAALNASDDYEAHRIALGIPDGAKDMRFEKSLLLEFRFEALNGVSFSKGCYVGQEVTARSKFRGQVRKELYKVESNKRLPATDTLIMSGSTQIGELRSVSGNHGLAILRSEELEKATAPLTADGIELTAYIPEWAQ